MLIAYGLLEQFHHIVMVCRHSYTFHIDLLSKIEIKKVTVVYFTKKNIHRHFFILLCNFLLEFLLEFALMLTIPKIMKKTPNVNQIQILDFCVENLTETSTSRKLSVVW